MIIINCKNYDEVSGTGISKLIGAAQYVSKKYGVKIAVAPPQHMLAMAPRKGVMILAQHIDDSQAGSTTGFVVPEMLKKSEVAGSLINHSEHRLDGRQIKRLVLKLRDLEMVSVLCVQNVAEARRYVALRPDYMAIEPPELIGTTDAISRKRPDLIVRTADLVKSANTQLLCGAGINSGEDVAKSIELGSSGILVASGILKAKDWKKTIAEFAKPFA